MRAVPVVILALALGACTLQQNVGSFSPSTRVGTKAPPLAGEGLDGGAISAEFQGHRTVLFFWASWCGPCRHEQPELNRIVSELGAQGIQFVGINFLDHDRAAARAFVGEFKVAYSSLYDPSGRLAARYDVDAPPAKVLIDARGVVVGRVPGEISESQLRGLIREKLP